jgi:L-asparaginase
MPVRKWGSDAKSTTVPSSVRDGGATHEVDGSPDWRRGPAVRHIAAPAAAQQRRGRGVTWTRRRTTMSVRVFVTGGTFDKEYDELRGTLHFRNTHVPEMLRLGRCRLEVAVETLMMIDSLDMTTADRVRMAEHCRSCDETQIVITHGTDTMVETAQTLADTVTGKTIVLTGAMVPYAFGSSDGLFNLGSALSFVQSLAPGVYIAMNGRCFRWDDVRKNREAGVFETLAE